MLYRFLYVINKNDIDFFRLNYLNLLQKGVDADKTNEKLMNV